MARRDIDYRLGQWLLAMAALHLGTLAGAPLDQSSAALGLAMGLTFFILGYLWVVVLLVDAIVQRRER